MVGARPVRFQLLVAGSPRWTASNASIGRERLTNQDTCVLPGTAEPLQRLRGDLVS